MVRHIDPEDEGGGTSGGGGGGGGSIGTPPPTGFTYLQSRRWMDVNWSYTEPQPEGRLTGFELAVFNGPNPDDGVLLTDIIQIPDTTARRWVQELVLRTQVGVKAAVRASFGDLGTSAWSPASLEVTFIPDQSSLGNASQGSGGWRKLPDGTLLQFFKTVDITQQNLTSINWPVPFPTACLMVQITAEDATGDILNDAWFQLRTYNQTGCTFLRQSANSTADSKFNKAHILALGY